MFCNEDTKEWVNHRLGISAGKFSRVQKKALELNNSWSIYADTLGQKDFLGYVGFVDLIGYSLKTMDLSPKESADYITPFLSKVTSLCCDVGCLVDKTIGDEVMFVLPEVVEEKGYPASFELGRLLNLLYDAQIALGNDYKFRIGISYGDLVVGNVKGRGYQELTVFGHNVNFAKRLHGISDLKEFEGTFGFFGAIGIVQHQLTPYQKFDIQLEYIAGIASKMQHRPPKSISPLKGIGEYKCELLYPKTSNEC